MQLTMTGEYAVRTMIHLSAQPFGTVVQIAEVSKQWNIPENFLRKISAQLASAELIVSHRGVNGGIRLGRPPESLTILDVIEAVEGKVVLNKCLMCDGSCPRDEWCQVHSLWLEAQAKMKEILTSKSLAQLVVENLNRKAEVEESGLQTSVA